MSAVDTDMLSRLEKLTVEIGALHSRLILLIGPPRSGKTALLKSFGERMGMVPLNIGSELGRQLMPVPHKQRHLQAGNLLRELAEMHAPGDLLLIDNIELLFDPSLQLSPLDLLKKQAHTKKVVAVWPRSHPPFPGSPSRYLRIPVKLDSDSTPSWTRIPEQAGQSERSDAGFWVFTLLMSWGSSFCRAM
jgi:hypothetical protein